MHSNESWCELRSLQRSLDQLEVCKMQNRVRNYCKLRIDTLHTQQCHCTKPKLLQVRIQAWIYHWILVQIVWSASYLCTHSHHWKLQRLYWQFKRCLWSSMLIIQLLPTPFQLFRMPKQDSKSQCRLLPQHFHQMLGLKQHQLRFKLLPLPKGHFLLPKVFFSIKESCEGFQ